MGWWRWAEGMVERSMAERVEESRGQKAQKLLFNCPLSRRWLPCSEEHIHQWAEIAFIIICGRPQLSIIVHDGSWFWEIANSALQTCEKHFPPPNGRLPKRIAVYRNCCDTHNYVARVPWQVPVLHDLLARGTKNGVEGLEILTGAQVEQMEPNVKVLWPSADNNRMLSNHLHSNHATCIKMDEYKLQTYTQTF